MEFVQVYVLLMVCLVVKGDSKVVQCYVCDDCDVLNDCLLKSCPLEIITPPPIFTTTTPTTIGNTTSGTGETTIPSTFPTTPNTSTVKTTITSTSSTRPTPGTGTVPETSTESELTSTDPSSTTADTTTPTEPTEETEETKETTERPITTTASTHQGVWQILRDKSVATYESKVSYHCYSMDIVDNNKWKKRRDCVKVPENKGACEVLREQYGCSSRNCKVCQQDGCNSSGPLIYSLKALVFAMVIGLYCK